MIISKFTPVTATQPLSIISVVIINIFVFITVSCNRSNDYPDNKGVSEKSIYDTVRSHNNRYAKGFKIFYHKGYKEIIVTNPWQEATDIRYRYILTGNRDDLPANIAENVQIFDIPAEKVICLSTTHLSALDLLGKINTLTGVSCPEYISNKMVNRLIKEGRIHDVGYDRNLNYELILNLDPDIVFAYGVGGETAGYLNKLKDLGIGVVANAEYLEETVLAKTEWIKFIAAFYDIEDIADEKYSLIEKEYTLYRQLADSVKDKPKVLTGMPWKGTWYVPGSDSYLAKMISDAGGELLWKDNSSSESVAMSIEAVFEKAREADIWINTGNANFKSDILFVDERIGKLQVFRKGKLYNNNARQNERGGNDYWESGMVNPQIILKDLVKIFHPDILPDHELVYYRKIE